MRNFVRHFGLMQKGRKEEARKMYETARFQATQRNDQRAAKYVEAKLKEL